jgi:hypothetical protein
MQYKTTDIVLAASLKVLGTELDTIEINGTKGTFVFKDVEQSFLLDYDLGKVLVEPVSFNNAIRQLTTSVRRML